MESCVLHETHACTQCVIHIHKMAVLIKNGGTLL